MADEPPQPQYISSREKSNANDDHACSEQFEEINNESVEAAKKRREHPMLAKRAVEDDLEHFDVDDDKACVDHEMQQRDQWISEHFLLTECQKQQIFPAFSAMIPVVFIAPKQNVCSYLSYFTRKYPDGDRQGNDKQNLLEVRHGLLIVHS
jgi:hypothetical protein